MDKKLMGMIAILGVLGWVVAGPVAYANSQEDPGTGHEKSWKHGDFLKDLNLTPEQTEKVKAQKEAQKASKQQVRDQLKAKMQALHEELGKPATDKAVLNGLVADINTLKGQLFSQRIDGLLSLKEILTPEQFSKLQEKFAKHQKQRGGDKKRSEEKEN